MKKAIEGTLPFGTAEKFGVNDGFVDFIEDDEYYRETVPDRVREELHGVITDLRQGKLHFGMPDY